MRVLESIAVIAGLAGSATARLTVPRNIHGDAIDGAPGPPTATFFTFDQRIDHFPNSTRYRPHDKGTYKQRYFVDASAYKPGGPVILSPGGEGSIEEIGLVAPSLLPDVFAQHFNGLLVVLEGRYYGQSYPFNASSTDQMVYATTEQTLADMDYFARNVRIPLKNISSINAPHTPWITYGGSLPGSQAAFAVKAYGNTFYAGLASSAPVHGVKGYAQWYNPVQKYAAQDCVASINNIVDNIDVLVDAKDTVALQRLKEVFGLGDLTDLRDFAQTIAFPIGGPDNYTGSSWQEIIWFDGGDSPFFDFCRNVTMVKPPANNTAVDQEFARYTNGRPWTNLGNYAAYIKRVILPYCASGDYNSADCFGTQHPSWWANTANNDYRSYLYGMCTEWGFYQDSQPRGTKSLISRVITPDYTQQWCEWSFPKGRYNAIPAGGPNLTRWNMYGDFNFSADRVALVDGSMDPWRDVCYHSDDAPPRYYTPDHPELLINGAGHCWDFDAFSTDFAGEPQFVYDAHMFEIRTLERWLDEFSSSKPGTA